LLLNRQLGRPDEWKWDIALLAAGEEKKARHIRSGWPS
jgi:hypothetical protein